MQGHGFQCSLKTFVQPRAGVASRLTLIASTVRTGLPGRYWVMSSGQVSTANQNHGYDAPIRFTAMSCQPVPDRR